jgi:hypothetical protein
VKIGSRSASGLSSDRSNDRSDDREETSSGGGRSESSAVSSSDWPSSRDEGTSANSVSSGRSVASLEMEVAIGYFWAVLARRSVGAWAREAQHRWGALTGFVGFKG